MYKKSIFIINSIVSFFILELFRLLKLTYLFGSKKIMFSAINIMGPLSGLSTFTFSGFGLCIVRDIMRLGLSKPLVYHIPTLCASAYWMDSGPLVRLFVPILCMILFNLHPVGSAAGAYCLYWLIPVIIYCTMSKDNILGKAVGSTFVAHAVGSVIWLYTMPMTSEQWLALIPQVALERSIFACGMIMVYYGSQYLLKAFEKINLTISNHATR